MSRSIRLDPTTGRRAIIAPERARRPSGYALGVAVPHERCPFCPGHEDATAPTLTAMPDATNWLARVFPNRFPALVIEEEPAGAHEVVVETPLHDLPIWRTPRSHQRAAMLLARDRLRDLAGDQRFQTLVWFRNHGPLSGASQQHPHAQIIALPYVPQRIDDMLHRCAAHPFAHLVDEAVHNGRLIAHRDGLHALCPVAPAAPFEVWILPDDEQADLRDASDARIEALADLASDVLSAIEVELGEMSVCVSLVTRPPHRDAPGLRWHLRIQPRLELPSGFEAATGDTIVGVPPAVSAALLREALQTA